MARPPREPTRVRLKDIADSLGLTANTVSRALSGKDQVSETTRERIVEEARRLGYVPNNQARSLVSGQSMVIALVITNPSNPLYAALITAVERHCRNAGYGVLLAVTEESAEAEERATEQLVAFGVDGVMGVPVQTALGGWQRLADAKIPAVLLSRDLPQLGLDYVGVDAEAAVADAVSRVITPRVSRAWMFEEGLPISTTVARVAGFRKAVAAAGLDQDACRVVEVPTRRIDGATALWSPDDAYEVAQTFITHDDHPDVIITGNDDFALGVSRAIREFGLEVPADVKVVGYGDHPFAAHVEPSLTSIRLPAAELAATATEFLLARIAKPRRRPQRRLVPAALVERASTA